MKLTKKEIKTLQIAIKSAIQNERSLIDAHSCQFCHGTKIFQNKLCLCKTGIIKGSLSIVHNTQKLINKFKQINLKLQHENTIQNH